MTDVTPRDWTFPECGELVPGGVYHTCDTRSWPPGQILTAEPDPQLARVAAALERIADALEKQNEPKPWYMPANAPQEASDD